MNKEMQACDECPFRRNSTPGYLGTASGDPHAFLDPHWHGDVRLPCHVKVDYEADDAQKQMRTAPLCQGFLTMTVNSLKIPRNVEMAAARYPALRRNTKDYFQNAQEFYDHHAEPWKPLTKIYVGDINELVGHYALYRDCVVDGFIEVQFDDQLVHPTTGLRLDLNWHEFPLVDFEDTKILTAAYYIGPMNDLVHEKALIRSTKDKDRVEAKFEHPMLLNPETGVRLDLCWYVFLSDHFSSEKPVFTREGQITMADLWRPISELDNITRDHGELLLCAPELVNLDYNENGVAPGYWQDGPLTLGGDEEGEWVAAGYCMEHEHFVNRSCKPTHFLILEGPKKLPPVTNLEVGMIFMAEFPFGKRKCEIVGIDAPDLVSYKLENDVGRFLDKVSTVSDIEGLVLAGEWVFVS